MTDNQPTLFDSIEQPEVEYRDVPGFPGYRVGTDGTVWSCIARQGLESGVGTRTFFGEIWRQKKATVDRGTGYYVVGLFVNKAHFNRQVHRLVLEAFVGPRPEGMVCCHYDGNPLNNCLNNLRWDTQKNNLLDRIRHGTMPEPSRLRPKRIARGEKHCHSKLTDDDIRSIRRMVSEGHTQRKVALLFSVKQATVSRIWLGRSWGHVV